MKCILGLTEKEMVDQIPFIVVILYAWETVTNWWAILRNKE